MGVKGLWSLLNPVARPVQIESMEGKRLAIDSSIWLYQFQATMRDKDGRVLVNAHVLGFLRRINKLLFHGIKPVFVFDGGAPVLKRNTIAERKRRKAGAAANHARMAEKLFAAQMRREAVKAAQASREQAAARQEARAAAEAARYDEDEGEQIAEGAVYLEDLEARPGLSRPRTDGPSSVSRPPLTTTSATQDPGPDPREERRKKFRKHDPYRLPEATMPSLSTEERPDARLATEDELKQFIDEVNPADIDVESAEFRALPTEVQYEIVGDLRSRSRQTSHKRLTDMLRAAPNALDFSMAQIKNLSQRNALTQQLLTVTDMVGKAHLTIPVRIAAERNREYVLVKRGENEGGGWALGIREGSKQKPIVVEPDRGQTGAPESDSEYDDDQDGETDTSDDSGIEEVDGPSAKVEKSQTPSRNRSQAIDADLREHRRREILEAIAARYAPKQVSRRKLDPEVKQFGKTRQPGAKPLFENDDEAAAEEEVIPTANDEALALALQQEELGSDEESADGDLARALAISRREAEKATASEEPSIPDQDVVDTKSPISTPGDLSDDSMEEVDLIPSGRNTPLEGSQSMASIPVGDESEDDHDFEEVKAIPVPSPRLQRRPEVAAAPAVATSGRPASAVTSPRSEDVIHHNGVAITESDRKSETAPLASSIPSTKVDTPIEIDDDDDIMPISPPPKPASTVTASQPTVRQGGQETRNIASTTRITAPGPSVAPQDISKTLKSQPSTSGTSTLTNTTNTVSRSQTRVPIAQTPSASTIVPTPVPDSPPAEDNLAQALLGVRAERPVDRHSRAEMSEEPSSYPNSEIDNDDVVDEDAEGQDAQDVGKEDALNKLDSDEEEEPIHWSRSPSPAARPPLQPAQSGESIPYEVEAEDEDVDMAPEDMAAEQDDYARFMAQIRNRDLNEVRGEIDDEIRVLNSQNKLAMRDSDEITQAMVAQIQTLLRHFGIPYITAPMEAEAQCAKLAELGLVDGIITDDSDVFLFGGLQCYKNIFNDAKYAECFLLSDLDREISLTRDRLISLAFLLGSDYTIGLPGVGPVVALELLANFPGPQGLDSFKEWWTKVQRGQDSVYDTDTKWKKSFKKKFAATILLTADWPNYLVREAYLYPQTDESEEPFHWGFPKLSALRTFLHEELSWSISKVDDELTPIVQRIARRGKTGALNVQATLDPFFDLTAGSGAYAPRRRREGTTSKRLLAIIKEYREAEARIAGTYVETPQPADVPANGSELKRKGSLAATEVGDGGTDDGKPAKKPRQPRKRKTAGSMGESLDSHSHDDYADKPRPKPRPKSRTGSSSNSAPPAPALESNGAGIEVPKHGLRGSATGIVGAGKRKKEALKAWRDSTRGKDLAP